MANLGVAGVDFSLTSTGTAFIAPGARIEKTLHKSTGKRNDTVKQRQTRLYDMANSIVSWVEERKPALVVVEAPSYGSRFGSPHDRSGLWWLVVNAILADGYPLAEVAPQARAKYGSGAGNSKKDVVFAHVVERYADLTDGRIKKDDEADAIILAAMGARHLGSPVEPLDLPRSNLAAMDGVAWPTT